MMCFPDSGHHGGAGDDFLHALFCPLQLFGGIRSELYFSLCLIQDDAGQISRGYDSVLGLQPVIQVLSQPLEPRNRQQKAVKCASSQIRRCRRIRVFSGKDHFHF